MTSFSLEDWWKEQDEAHPTCTSEYWEEQQCSLKELNEWIIKRKQEDE